MSCLSPRKSLPRKNPDQVWDCVLFNEFQASPCGVKLSWDTIGEVVKEELEREDLKKDELLPFDQEMCGDPFAVNLCDDILDEKMTIFRMKAWGEVHEFKETGRFMLQPQAKNAHFAHSTPKFSYRDLYKSHLSKLKDKESSSCGRNQSHICLCAKGVICGNQ